MAVDNRRLQELFDLAVKLPLADRMAFLNRECSADAELRQQVEALLQDHEAASSFLAEPTPSAATGEYTPEPDDAPHTSATTRYQPAGEVGAVIAGRYTLVETIGEGGMGEVWVAQQSEPVKRKVALKLIKAGMDTKAVLQRFDAERQALAMMDHPNIAKVLDGGMTADRRPFFVMELVNGMSLTKYCDEAKLGVRQRLELFVAICQAVQHAHQKGIVHRDLKPSNILVTIIDGRPVPKVIDFGVAKAVGGKLTDDSLSTGFGTVVGTLEYMSPEQAGFSGVDIDTRTDIYSLGVILYELLTGLRPIDSKRLRQAALTEMVRIIQEEEPSKPSTRLSTDRSLPSLAALRDTEPKKLRALLRGELDWVVMKCLEKDRNRRYETANGLARDLQRYMADEPVEAHAPSNIYRIRKFVQRNRASVLAGSLLLLALVGGIVGTTIGMVRAEKARAAEVQQRKRAETIVGFMDETLRGAAPGVAKGRDSKLLKELMDGAAARITAGQLQDDPEAELQLRRTIGTVYCGLGEFDSSEANLRRATAMAIAHFGRDDPRTDDVELDLCECLFVRGRYDETKTIAQHVLAACDARKEPECERAALAWQYLGHSSYNATGGDLAEQEKALRQTVEIRRKIYPAGDPRIGRALGLLAFSLRERNDLVQAASMTREALEISRNSNGPLHPNTISMACSLADILNAQKKYLETEQLMRATLADAEALYGPSHRGVADVLWRMGNAISRLGDPKRAETLHERCLAIRREQYPGGHKDVATALAALADDKLLLGNAAGAEPLVREALEMRRKLFEPNSPVMAAGIEEFADCLAGMGRRQEAQAAYEQALAIWKNVRPNSVEVLHATNSLAVEVEKQNDLDRAIQLYNEVLEGKKKRYGDENSDVATAMTNLGAAYFRKGRKTEAEELFRQAIDMSRSLGEVPTPSTVNRYGNLAFLLEDRGDYAGAEPLHREILELQTKILGPGHAAQAGVLARLGDNLIKQNRPADAELILRRCLEFRIKNAPDVWTTHNTKSMLGGVLLAQKKYAEAEPLLLAGYEGMKKQEITIPAGAKTRLPDAVERLVKLNEALDKKDEAAKWRAELEKLKAEKK